MASVEGAVARVGTVVSGRGQATDMLKGRPELSEYFGLTPQPGSLNVLLDRPIELRPERIRVRLQHDLVAWRGRVNGQECLILRWHNCPLHVAEIISPHCFALAKGKTALIEFSSEDVAVPSRRKAVGWWALWALRKRVFYAGDHYRHWCDELAAKFPAWFRQQPVHPYPLPLRRGFRSDVTYGAAPGGAIRGR